MLGRLVAKLLFKACVPLVAVAGVMTYGVYLKGGDPIGLWKHVATGAFGQAGDMVTRAKNDAAGLAENLTAAKSPTQATHPSGSTTVFTWKDAKGVTHFGTTAPTGISAQTITVEPNVNVVAPVVAKNSPDDADNPGNTPLPGSGFVQTGRAGSQQARNPSVNRAAQQLESDMGEPLPGIAGQMLRSGATGSAGMDPSQLIRLLQSASD